MPEVDLVEVEVAHDADDDAAGGDDGVDGVGGSPGFKARSAPTSVATVRNTSSAAADERGGNVGGIPAELDCGDHRGVLADDADRRRRRSPPAMARSMSSR